MFIHTHRSGRGSIHLSRDYKPNMDAIAQVSRTKRTQQ